MRANGLLVAEQCCSTESPRVQAVASLTDLRQLRRIAEQHDVLRAERERERVGQRDLAGFVDEEIIELAGELFAREEPTVPPRELVPAAVKASFALPIRSSAHEAWSGTPSSRFARVCL